MKKILLFFTWLRVMLFPTALEKANRKLMQATKNEIEQRARLRKQIESDVKKKFGYKFGSEYIPNKGFNKALIYDNVQEHYSNDMKNLNITLTKNLTWK